MLINIVFKKVDSKEFLKFKNQKIYKDRIEPVLQLCKNKKVLDIGCTGSDAFKGKIYDDKPPVHEQLNLVSQQCFGIDIFVEGINCLLDRGLKVAVASAEDFDLPEKDFDVCVLGDVIEHVSNPGLVFDNAYKHLKFGGEIIVTTPNVFSLHLIIKKIFNLKVLLNVEHCTWFDPLLLSLLLNRSKFKMTELFWTGSSDIFLLKYLISKRKSLHSTFGIIAKKETS